MLKQMNSRNALTNLRPSVTQFFSGNLLCIHLGSYRSLTDIDFFSLLPRLSELKARPAACENARLYLAELQKVSIQKTKQCFCCCSTS